MSNDDDNLDLDALAHALVRDAVARQGNDGWLPGEMTALRRARLESGERLVTLDKDGGLVIADEKTAKRLAPAYMLAREDSDTAKATRAMRREKALGGSAGAPDRAGAAAEIAKLAPLKPNASDQTKCERADAVAKIYKRHGY